MRTGGVRVCPLAAAAWMRRLRDDPGLGRDMGRRASSSITSGNSTRRVGELIAEALASGPDLARRAA